MTATEYCPAWCTHHERDHEGALLHTRPIADQGIAVERYDLPSGFEGEPEPEDYIWLPFGEGIPMNEDEARAHVALVLEAIEILAAARRRRVVAV